MCEGPDLHISTADAAVDYHSVCSCLLQRSHACKVSAQDEASIVPSSQCTVSRPQITQLQRTAGMALPVVRWSWPSCLVYLINNFMRPCCVTNDVQPAGLHAPGQYCIICIVCCIFGICLCICPKGFQPTEATASTVIQCQAA